MHVPCASSRVTVTAVVLHNTQVVRFVLTKLKEAREDLPGDGALPHSVSELYIVNQCRPMLSLCRQQLRGWTRGTCSQMARNRVCATLEVSRKFRSPFDTLLMFSGRRPRKLDLSETQRRLFQTPMYNNEHATLVVN